MFTGTCPSCGAPLSFKAASSTTAVCAFCKSTIARDSDSLKLIGKQAELLEDFSRLQITTEGTHQGKPFSIVGRIQMRYDAGVWNEWYLLFSDSTTAWLSETASGFTILRSAGQVPGVITFDSAAAGQRVAINQQQFTITDKRVAQCVAAQGELPFPVDSRWEAKTLDLKSDKQFLTFDFSDGGPPEVYRGLSLTANDLSLTRLKETTDRFTGAAIIGATSPKLITALSCKACGAPIKLVPSLSTNVVCPSCASELREQNGSLLLEVERANKQLRWTTLSPGDTGTYFGYEWTVLGVMSRFDRADHGDQWEEYLLYHADQGLRWLSHADGEWQWIQVLDAEPVHENNQVRFDNVLYVAQSKYVAETDYVAGAFNWRAKVGDRVTVNQYVQGDHCLSREATNEEVTWSLGRKQRAQDIMTAFGKAKKVRAAPTLEKEEDSNQLLTYSIVASAALLIIVGPAWLMSGFDSPLEETLIGLMALWAPHYFINRNSQD
jgi:uncharacterized Zn finger protein (UPF0148 family)